MALVSAEEGVARLEALVAGLLFVSESDRPFTVLRLGAVPVLDERQLLAALGAPAGVPIERRSPSEFFARAVEAQSWHGPAERAIAERYRTLLAFFGSGLADTRVYRLGRVEIDAYVLGKSADGEWLGVATKQVET